MNHPQNVGNIHMNGLKVDADGPYRKNEKGNTVTHSGMVPERYLTARPLYKTLSTWPISLTDKTSVNENN